MYRLLVDGRALALLPLLSATALLRIGTEGANRCLAVSTGPGGSAGPGRTAGPGGCSGRAAAEHRLRTPARGRGRPLDPGLDLEAPAPAPGGEGTIVAQALRQLERGGSFNLDETLRAWERGYIDAALRLTRGNVSQAAKLLGVNRTTLYSRMNSGMNSGEDK